MSLNLRIPIIACLNFQVTSATAADQSAFGFVSLSRYSPHHVSPRSILTRCALSCLNETLYQVCPYSIWRRRCFPSILPSISSTARRQSSRRRRRHISSNTARATDPNPYKYPSPESVCPLLLCSSSPC